ncbi:hypothetical protein DFH06DRAFT_1130100 [Mycena polygramma]|nr:hypothetical protein DFH06DRAFT_1130100 [Mycena polygramma]
MPALRTRTTHPPVRSLDVSTAAAPSLKIIAPTPRTFTFPPAHNLADSPFSSPSNSPFERDLRFDASSAATPSPSAFSSDYDRAPLPLSAFTRTLFPESSSGTPSPAPQTPIDSTDTVIDATVEERRPKKGDDDYVKRPENAFILFRRECAASLSSSSTSPSAPSPTPSASSSAPSPSLVAPPPKKQRQAELSKTISQRWKALSPEERAHWDALAKEKKRQHEMLHPNYVYRPRRSGAKNRPRQTDPSASAFTTPGPPERRKHSVPPPQQIEFVLPTPPAHGRSSSAPTPPPYQTFQIPDLYAEAPPPSSYDASVDDPASLMHLLSQFGMGSGGGGFDYVPSNSNNFESGGNAEPSAFMRAMFPPINAQSQPSDASMRSPASSTGGSAPSSPYTPACTSFHPSVFSSSSPADPDTVLDASGDCAQAEYSPYAASWFAASPWACAPNQAGLVPGDFDIGRVPEMEFQWGLGQGEFSALDGVYTGGDPQPHSQSQGQQGAGEGRQAMEDLDVPYDDLFNLSFDGADQEQTAMAMA